MDFSNSWMGNINSNLIGIYKDFYSAGEVEVGMTRTDHNSITGSGAIAHIEFTIKDDVLPKSSSSFIRLDFDITTVVFVDEIGDDVPTNPQPGQIMVTDEITMIGNIEQTENTIIASPNPTNGTLLIESLSRNIDQIVIYDIRRQLITGKYAVGSLKSNLDLNRLPSGMYILNVSTGSSVQNFRVVKY